MAPSFTDGRLLAALRELLRTHVVPTNAPFATQEAGYKARAVAEGYLKDAGLCPTQS